MGLFRAVWPLAALLLLVNCSSKQDADVADAAKSPDVSTFKVGQEDLPSHNTGPDDSDFGGLSPKADPALAKDVVTPKEAPAQEEPDQPPQPTPAELAAGISDEALKSLTGPVASIFRKPELLPHDKSAISFAYRFDEGQKVKGKLYSRVTARGEGDATNLVWSMTWSEHYGAKKLDLVPVKWTLDELNYGLAGASEDEVQSLSKALSGMLVTYQIDSLGQISGAERVSNVPKDFEKLADALVEGLNQKFLDLAKVPLKSGRGWMSKQKLVVAGTVISTDFRYVYRGKIRGPSGNELAYVDFTIRSGVSPEKRGGKSAKGKGLGRGAFLFDLEKGTDVAMVMRLDIQEEFSESSDKDAIKTRQNVSMELVSERLF